jgi:hypothetical protein
MLVYVFIAIGTEDRVLALTSFNLKYPLNRTTAKNEERPNLRFAIERFQIRISVWPLAKLKNFSPPHQVNAGVVP